MDYTDFTYLWPPRPETKIARQNLGFYEHRGYWAQKKKNGTCTVIFCKGDTVIFKTRHNDDHKQWSPLPEHVEFFKGRSEWTVYVAELLHSKTKHLKNEIYIFDKLVADGKQLVGTTFAERQQQLLDDFNVTPGDDRCEGDQYRLSGGVTLSKCFSLGFLKTFDNLKAEDEGIVLKDPKAVLRACFKHDSNRSWQVKCRIPTKNYTY